MSTLRNLRSTDGNMPATCWAVVKLVHDASGNPSPYMLAYFESHDAARRFGVYAIETGAAAQVRIERWEARYHNNVAKLTQIVVEDLPPTHARRMARCS